MADLLDIAIIYYNNLTEEQKGNLQAFPDSQARGDACHSDQAFHRVHGDHDSYQYSARGGSW